MKNSNKNLEEQSTELIGFAFNVSEDTLNASLFNFLLQSKEVPPAVAAKAKIKAIEKEYYAFYNCEGSYSANWPITCYWEHQEEYITYESVIVYVKDSREYSYQVAGSTPVSKVVPKKNYKTIIDNTQTHFLNRSGHYSGLISSQGIDSAMSQWVNSEFTTYIPKPIILDSLEIKKFSVFDGDNYNASKIAIAERVKREAYYSMQKDMNIPRCSRYSGGELDFQNSFEITQKLYLPIYKVIYEYNGRQFEAWFPGFKSGNGFSEKTPEPKIKKASKYLLILAAISFVLDALLLIFTAVSADSLSLIARNNLLILIIIVFAIFSISGILGVVLEKSYTKMLRRWDETKKNLQPDKEKNMMNTNLQSVNKGAKKSKKIAIIFCFAVICIFVFMFFMNHKSSDIVGTWKAERDSSVSITFKNNGDMIVRSKSAVNDELSYKIVNDTVTVTYAPNDTETYGFVVEGDTLIFGEYYYTRVK